ncbi:MAG: hypothetical protein WCJ30_00560 [Deltaproteobacteria bacterium]
MEPDDTLSVGRLLDALVAAANGRADAASLLHERVTLHRLDGVRLEGREAVIDAVVTRGTEARFRVLSTRVDALVVALEIEGVPGRLRFEMHGTVLEGRLYEIWMRG